MLHTRAWYYMKVFADPKNADIVWVLNAPVQQVDRRRADVHDVPRRRTATTTPLDQPDDSPTRDRRQRRRRQRHRSTAARAGPRRTTSRRRSSTASTPTTSSRTASTPGSRTTRRSRSPSAAPGGIRERDWYDGRRVRERLHRRSIRDDPRYVYAGCYRASSASSTRRPAPRATSWRARRCPRRCRRASRSTASTGARPIVVSPHDPTVDLPRRQRAVAHRRPRPDVDARSVPT